MPDHIEMTMLPAKEGDCLLVSYGDEAAPQYILIDGGRAWTYKNALKGMLAEKNIHQLELIVITHVDRDHIDGILALIKDDDLHLEVKNIWFNGLAHLEGNAVVQADVDDLEHFGAKMGEEISPLIIEKSWPWNKQFNGFSVSVKEDPTDNIIQLGDIQFTLLSPDQDKLAEMKDKWIKECRNAGIAPGTNVENYVVVDDDIETLGSVNIEILASENFSGDDSEANGSSIAFILEYKGKKMLLSGDAHANLLEKSLKQLGASEHEPLKVDLFKIPHHASKYNLSAKLLKLLDCDHYLVSTNGNYFKHPEDVAIARMIKFGSKNSTIHFNYKTEFNDFWQNTTWENTYEYQVSYPEPNEDGYKRLKFLINST